MWAAPAGACSAKTRPSQIEVRSVLKIDLKRRRFQSAVWIHVISESRCHCLPLFYECPVGVVNVFSLKRVVCLILFFLRVSYIFYIPPPPWLKGTVIISAREICLLSYTNSVDFYVSELFVFSLFFLLPLLLLIAHVLVGVWWCVTVIALP